MELCWTFSFLKTIFLQDGKDVTGRRRADTGSQALQQMGQGGGSLWEWRCQGSVSAWIRKRLDASVSRTVATAGSLGSSLRVSWTTGLGLWPGSLDFSMGSPFNHLQFQNNWTVRERQREHYGLTWGMLNSCSKYCNFKVFLEIFESKGAPPAIKNLQLAKDVHLWALTTTGPP